MAQGKLRPWLGLVLVGLALATGASIGCGAARPGGRAAPQPGDPPAKIASDRALATHATGFVLAPGASRLALGERRTFVASPRGLVGAFGAPLFEEDIRSSGGWVFVAPGSVFVLREEGATVLSGCGPEARRFWTSDAPHAFVLQGQGDWDAFQAFLIERTATHLSRQFHIVRGAAKRLVDDWASGTVSAPNRRAQAALIAKRFDPARYQPMTLRLPLLLEGTDEVDDGVRAWMRMPASPCSSPNEPLPMPDWDPRRGVLAVLEILQTSDVAKLGKPSLLLDLLQEPLARQTTWDAAWEAFQNGVAHLGVVTAPQ